MLWHNLYGNMVGFEISKQDKTRLISRPPLQKDYGEG